MTMLTEEELSALVELEGYVLSVTHLKNAGGDWVGAIHHKNGILTGGRLRAASAKTKQGCINKLFKRWVEK